MDFGVGSTAEVYVFLRDKLSLISKLVKIFCSGPQLPVKEFQSRGTEKLRNCTPTKGGLHYSEGADFLGVFMRPAPTCTRSNPLPRPPAPAVLTSSEVLEAPNPPPMFNHVSSGRWTSLECTYSYDVNYLHHTSGILGAPSCRRVAPNPAV